MSHPEFTKPFINVLDVKVQFYTVSMREAERILVSRVLGNTLTLSLMDKGGNPLTNGRYYRVIHARGQKRLTKILFTLTGFYGRLSHK